MIQRFLIKSLNVTPNFPSIIYTKYASKGNCRYWTLQYSSFKISKGRNKHIAYALFNDEVHQKSAVVTQFC